MKVTYEVYGPLSSAYLKRVFVLETCKVKHLQLREKVIWMKNFTPP